MENEILEAISHIKNVSKKSPTAEKPQLQILI